MNIAEIPPLLVLCGEKCSELLVPFGFQICLSRRHADVDAICGGSPGIYYSGMAYYLEWRLFVRAKGQFCDGCYIGGSILLDETLWQEDRLNDPAKLARDIMRAAYAEIMRPPPPAIECDWRPSEVIPEDFYAA